MHARLVFVFVFVFVFLFVFVFVFAFVFVLYNYILQRVKTQSRKEENISLWPLGISQHFMARSQLVTNIQAFVNILQNFNKFLEKNHDSSVKECLQFFAQDP